MDILTTGASLAVVLGLVEALKLMIGNSRFSAFFAIIIGIGVAFLTSPDIVIRTIILQGVLNGLSASGLYSGTKAITKPTITNDPIA